jgi:hypothetical protein
MTETLTNWLIDSFGEIQYSSGTCKEEGTSVFLPRIQRTIAVDASTTQADVLRQIKMEDLRVYKQKLKFAQEKIPHYKKMIAQLEKELAPYKNIDA